MKTIVKNNRKCTYVNLQYVYLCVHYNITIFQGTLAKLSLKDMNLPLKPFYNEVSKCSTLFHYIEMRLLMH